MIKKALHYLDNILQLEARVKEQLPRNQSKLMTWVVLAGMFGGLFFALFGLVDFYVSYFNANLSAGQAEIKALGMLTSETALGKLALFFVFLSIIAPMFVGMALAGLLCNLAIWFAKGHEPELLSSYLRESTVFSLIALLFFIALVALGFVGIHILATG